MIVTQPTSLTVIYTVANPACPAELLSDTLTKFLTSTTTPAFNAGPNQEMCTVNGFPTTATLNGTNYEYQVSWQLIYSSSGAIPTINNPGAATTTVSFPSDGIYRFQYSILPLSANCSLPLYTDIVQVTIS